MTVDQSDDDFTVLVFECDELEVARLRRPADDAAARTDGLGEWRLTSAMLPETTILGPVGPRPTPPLANAMQYLSLFLDEKEEDADDER